MATFPTALDDRLPFPISQRVVNLDPVIPVVRRILSDVDLSASLKSAALFADSSALNNVSLISLRSIPYAYYGDNAWVREFDNGLSCRMRYLEAVVTSTAAVVHNLVFGVVFSVASVVTFGQVKWLNDQMQKHCVHVAFAVAAVGISCCGTVSPQFGIMANLTAGVYIANVLLLMGQREIISKICSAYRQHHQELKSATAQACRNSRIEYDREFTPFYNYLDSHLSGDVNTLPELVEVFNGAAQQIPSPRIIPFASPGVIMDEFRLLSASQNRTQTT
jgi:hypothetical protein